MSKVQSSPFIPIARGTEATVIAIRDAFTQYAQQVNAAYDGRISAALSTSSTPATTLASVTVSVGDFIRNDAVTETGGAGSKYVILGWVATTAGTAGGSAVFKECRCLTGN